jgi:hypothetical protein
MKTKITLDLADYQENKSRVFTGRDFGKEVKESTHINELINMFDVVNIKVPDNIGSINPSFLEEFLYDVVIELGEERIYEKVVFLCPGNYIDSMKADVDESISRILRTKESGIVIKDKRRNHLLLGPLADMDRYFTEMRVKQILIPSEMLKQRKKYLEYLVQVGEVTKEYAEKRMKEDDFK